MREAAECIDATLIIFMFDVTLATTNEIHAKSILTGIFY